MQASGIRTSPARCLRKWNFWSGKKPHPMWCLESSVSAQPSTAMSCVAASSTSTKNRDVIDTISASFNRCSAQSALISISAALASCIGTCMAPFPSFKCCLIANDCSIASPLTSKTPSPLPTQPSVHHGDIKGQGDVLLQEKFAPPRTSVAQMFWSTPSQRWGSTAV